MRHASVATLRSMTCCPPAALWATAPRPDYQRQPSLPAGRHWTTNLAKHSPLAGRSTTWSRSAATWSWTARSMCPCRQAAPSVPASTACSTMAAHLTNNGLDLGMMPAGSNTVADIDRRSGEPGEYRWAGPATSGTAMPAPRTTAHQWRRRRLAGQRRRRQLDRDQWRRECAVCRWRLRVFAGAAGTVTIDNSLGM